MLARLLLLLAAYLDTPAFMSIQRETEQANPLNLARLRLRLRLRIRGTIYSFGDDAFDIIEFYTKSDTRPSTVARNCLRAGGTAIYPIRTHDVPLHLRPQGVGKMGMAPP